MADFDLSPDPAQPSPDAGLPDAVGNMAGYLQERGGRQAKEQFDAANTKIVHNVTDGTVQVNMSADTFKEYAEAKQHSDQIYSIYNDTVQRLEAQRQQIREHPFANTLAVIAGSLAANDPNPISRGLGQAAQRLNPTDAELQAREQIPLAGMREVNQQRLGLAREDRLASAQEKRLDLESRRLESQEARQKATEEHQNKMSDLYQQRTEATERMNSERLDARERESAKRMEFELRRQEIAENARYQRDQAKAEAAAAKAEGKKMEVSKDVDKQLSNLSAAEKSLDNIDKVIDKYGKYMGAVSGRTVAPVVGYFKKDVAQAEANLKLEVAQAIQATGAGARGFGPQERSFFEKLATGMTRSPEENKGTVEAWRQYIQQKRGSLADVYPGLHSPKYKTAFGRDADLIDDATESTGDPVEDILRKYAKPK